MHVRDNPFSKPERIDLVKEKSNDRKIWKRKIFLYLMFIVNTHSL